jgi:hypothetical protein
VDALGELRALRRRKRLAAQEWFELAYRVYIVAFGVLGATVLLAHAVGDDPLTPAQRADLFEHGPTVVGLVAAVLFAMGLRSGSRGGPLSVEAAEVRYVLLAPISHRVSLAQPAMQALRRAAIVGAGVGALGGLLIGRRLDDALAGWIAGAAVAGMVAAVAAVAAALVVHALRVPRWLATLIGGVLIAWQAAARAGDEWPGPFDTIGHLAFWANDVTPIDAVAIAAAAALTWAGVAMLDRLSLDALSRRSALVSQLRFAVTMRDLRTVVLLRRQLANEQHRTTPWLKVGALRRWPVAHRGARSIARFPSVRLVRIVLLTAGAAVAQVVAYRGTTPAVLVSGLLAFVLGLECLEPFAQEFDQPDRRDTMPHPVGWILVRHLPVPAVVAAGFGAIGAVGVLAVTEDWSDWGVAAIVMLPVVWGGTAGAVLNVLSGAPEPVSTTTNEMLPPEVAGFREVLRTALPLAVAVAGSLPILAARAASRVGDDPRPPAVQAGVAVGLLIAAVVWWARHSVTTKARFRALWAAGDAEFKTRQQAKTARQDADGGPA